jgi:putative colanic acid biosynthesis acetyltransferase WcaF
VKLGPNQRYAHSEEPPIIDLRSARNADDFRERPRLVQALWVLVETLLVSNPLVLSSAVRRWALRCFGARIGRGVIIRSRVRVKYPWKLSVGDWSWIGEGVWIDNHGYVHVGSHCVLSQEVFITTGSHDYLSTMDLIVEDVRVEDGAWLTARVIVNRGVNVGRSSLVTPGSVVTRDIPAGKIFGGAPAKFLKSRWEEQ